MVCPSGYSEQTKVFSKENAWNRTLGSFSFSVSGSALHSCYEIFQCIVFMSLIPLIHHLLEIWQYPILYTSKEKKKNKPIQQQKKPRKAKCLLVNSTYPDVCVLLVLSGDCCSLADKLPINNTGNNFHTYQRVEKF